MKNTWTGVFEDTRNIREYKSGKKYFLKMQACETSQYLK
jgi:hypothetical protein